MIVDKAIYVCDWCSQFLSHGYAVISIDLILYILE